MTLEEFSEYENGHIHIDSDDFIIVGYDRTSDVLIGVLENAKANKSRWIFQQKIESEYIPEKYNSEKYAFKAIYPSDFKLIELRSRNKDQLRSQLVI